MPGRLPRPVEAVAYFVVSEALTNVVKHSGASRAQVVARVDGGTLRLRIVDDGAGGADDSRGTGLTGLRQRVASVDGTLTVESPLGGPTCWRRGSHAGRDRLAGTRPCCARAWSGYWRSTASRPWRPSTLRRRSSRPSTLAPDLAVIGVRMPPTFSDEGDSRGAGDPLQWPRSPSSSLASTSRSGMPPNSSAGQRRSVSYLLKDRVADVEDFLGAVRRVADGGTALDPEVVAQLLVRRVGSPVDRLTPREHEVLSLMAEGLSNAGIAAALVVSESAVAKHVNSIFAKLPLSETPAPHRRVLAVLEFLAARKEPSWNPATPQDAPPPGSTDAATPTTFSSPGFGQPSVPAPASVVDPRRNVPERGLWVAAGMALVAMAVGGAWFGAWSTVTTCRSPKTAVYAAGSVDFRNLGDHDVKVVGTDRRDILVTRTVTWVRSPDAPPTPREVVSDSTLVIDNPCDSVGLLCSVDYRIEVPLKAAVHWASGQRRPVCRERHLRRRQGVQQRHHPPRGRHRRRRAMSGDVDICGVDTSLAVQTQPGEVEACDVTGTSAVVSTASGGVQFEGGPPGRDDPHGLRRCRCRISPRRSAMPSRPRPRAVTWTSTSSPTGRPGRSTSRPRRVTSPSGDESQLTRTAGQG